MVAKLTTYHRGRTRNDDSKRATAECKRCQAERLGSEEANFIREFVADQLPHFEYEWAGLDPFAAYFAEQDRRDQLKVEARATFRCRFNVSFAIS